ncbi:MAG: DNA topoisomerase VI subunit B [Thermoproteota archaeon]|nr:DNA topoisomerase VI subunit B [Thermoproteota archaeon]
MKTKASVEIAATMRAKTASNTTSVATIPPPSYGRAKVRYDKKAESEFFVDNSALAGFTGERILYMAVRELIENALDSCEIHRILPNISLSLKLLDQANDLWLISCEDNGIGIPSDKVPVAVCSFLTSAKYVEKQQRGLFGVGLKMIAAFSTKDTDHPLRTWSKSSEEGSEYYYELRTDIGTNKPIILTKKLLRGEEVHINGESGFKIEAVLRARLSPITKNKIYDYVSHTSIVNPYAFLVFQTDEGKVTFDRRTTIMPEPAKEVLPHPADMDLKTLKKAIMNFMHQKTTLHGVLCNSFQKLSGGKAKEIITKSNVALKAADKYDEHELIKVVNVCKQTRFHAPSTDHLSPIGEEILTAGMTSEYTIVTNRNETDSQLQTRLSIKVLKPTLTAYSSRTCVVNNRPTVVECGIAYGGDISSFKLFRFANKIPLLYDEGSDVAREVVSDVEINKMGISKKEVKEQFARADNRSDRAVEFLPIHIFFHICSTKIPYKTAGKESIASEGDLKKYMKACLADLYRKVSAQIRKELRMKEAESRLRLYKHYIPLIISAISESIMVDTQKLSEAFSQLAEKHVRGEITGVAVSEKHDKITGRRIEEEADKSSLLLNGKRPQRTSKSARTQENMKVQGNRTAAKKNIKNLRGYQKKDQTTMDVFYRPDGRRKR